LADETPIVRPASRVLLIEPEDRILLLRANIEA